MFPKSFHGLGSSVPSESALSDQAAVAQLPPLLSGCDRSGGIVAAAARRLASPGPIPPLAVAKLGGAFHRGGRLGGVRLVEDVGAVHLADAARPLAPAGIADGHRK